MGEQILKKKLTDIVLSGRVHHAYIIEGPHSADKLGAAKFFCKALLCRETPGCGKCACCKKIDSMNHIDITHIGATGASSKSRSVKDDDVEKALVRLAKKPYEAERNICIIEDADSMTLRAANRLLKTLEEPPEGTVIMLLSENMTRMPQTIRSRAVHLRMSSEDASDDEYTEVAERFVSLLLAGAPYCETAEILKGISGREDAIKFLDRLEEVYRGRLMKPNVEMKKEYIFRAVEEIEKARRKLMRNITASYALKGMMLKIGG